jgi:hypothetical protein
MITGHRPQHLDRRSLVWIDAELRRIAWKLHFEHGATTMLSGMALFCDQVWAGYAEQMGVALAAHVPFPQQPDRWRDPALVERYHQLLAYADRTGGVTVYGDLAGLVDPVRKRRADELLFARNDGMLAATKAAAGVVVAVLRSAHVGGGTRDTYDKALRMGLRVIRVDPDRRTTVMASLGRRDEQETLL